ncbi:hypothetical protein NKG94_05360 [Micromonospora sp. M12]
MTRHEVRLIRTRLVVLTAVLVTLWSYAAYVASQDAVDLLRVRALADTLGQPIDRLILGLQTERRATAETIAGTGRTATRWSGHARLPTGPSPRSAGSPRAATFGCSPPAPSATGPASWSDGSTAWARPGPRWTPDGSTRPGPLTGTTRSSTSPSGCTARSGARTRARWPPTPAR